MVTFTTAFIIISYLVNLVAVVNGRFDKEYNKIFAEIKKATPITGRIARQIENASQDIDKVEVIQPDYSKPKSNMLLIISKW